MILQKFLASLWTCLNGFETSNISKLVKGPHTGTLKVLDGQIGTLQEELREQMRSDAVEACQMPPPAHFCSTSTLLVLEPDICVISEFMGHCSRPCKECQLWTSAADHQLRSNPQPMVRVNGQCGGWRFFFQTKNRNSGALVSNNLVLLQHVSTLKPVFWSLKKTVFCLWDEHCAKVRSAEKGGALDMS